VAGASNVETQVLKRNILSPKQDFVVLPLDDAMVKPTMAIPHEKDDFRES
jgi:hypothetical protein